VKHHQPAPVPTPIRNRSEELTGFTAGGSVNAGLLSAISRDKLLANVENRFMPGLMVDAAAELLPARTRTDGAGLRDRARGGPARCD
jgi:hypothetical protein